MRLKKLAIILAFGTLPVLSFAQKDQKTPENWFNLDFQQDGVMGISTEKAYQTLLKGRKATPVIVAVIDGGVDVKHEDLKDVLWINPKDNNDNGKDNDKNGYINDKYGWNFIGNANGENVNHDNLELTRLIRKYEPKYISVLPSTPLSAAERREFVAYQGMVSEYAKKLEEAQFGEMNYVKLKDQLEIIFKKIGKDASTLTLADIEAYSPANDQEKMALRIAKRGIQEEKGSVSQFYTQLGEAATYYGDQVKYHLNKEFDPRHIIGDNYDDATERYYGNADVTGPDAEHGTHVAGIIGAKRNNNIGINGVADQVRIMAVRTVPNGDERDKDVANAIRYAAENGAKVINMSFGKSYAYNKKAVDDAVKFAISKDVLLVHAAGNDGQDVDIHKNFPTKYYTDSLDAIQGEADAWITVGASGLYQDDNLVADFSNYGYKTVDVFAPGVKINSTMPGSLYKEQQGTSMASPVVAGLAAMIRSYYPQLTAKETKDIIMKSVVKVDKKVTIKAEDGSKKKVYLDEISVTGGVVNAYQAIAEADKYLSQKKK
ncbi:S8 family serine peptidase [Sphingobacterium spiritivorum]|uniref:S8 family serine peptidase n=1 Tax=Sphingobacterium spiritivorum TaxID=258 RepID=UPI003DA2619C